MKNRFYFDRSLTNGAIIILAIAFTAMAGLSLLGGFSERPFVFLGVVYSILILIWFGFAYGIYINIEGNSLQVTRFFIKCKKVDLAKAISIQQKPKFGGLIYEVSLQFQDNNGKIDSTGLINKPALKVEEYERLVKLVIEINKDVSIDPDLLKKVF
ncbi:hypothetical protein A2419_01820 [Candidatus Adlerbacteria bacterium RIFOXYC1_FULL_48_26]|uniref:Uncharacterized protein n=1 Tax=Candidatus Adlerbacteria bacterium RIFOXYC1_FULL_48_26 TaxID=1797247 RepID=A0A1F4Y3B8_9BACT|nr:MAG: hypothetical protein A2419_01820 [Candidatus Adlerbacteria bacterium RIFOXYC1_FULL_48_26]OGC93850.1 MAG: hypothetical protein A2389_00350 [Candidatus Adlerbacteria bacterium RIFOXYB1_FULL_48_10]OGC95047.1 MAG: hypothetical protein A2590_02385 [Candidatus Adlerbacteria bacterium RIFOXYD1_FULL_48_8]